MERLAGDENLIWVCFDRCNDVEMLLLLKFSRGLEDLVLRDVTRLRAHVVSLESHVSDRYSLLQPSNDVPVETDQRLLSPVASRVAP